MRSQITDADLQEFMETGPSAAGLGKTVLLNIHYSDPSSYSYRRENATDSALIIDANGYSLFGHVEGFCHRIQRQRFYQTGGPTPGGRHVLWWEWGRRKPPLPFHCRLELFIFWESWLHCRQPPRQRTTAPKPTKLIMEKTAWPVWMN